jgi:hypothetical protein
MSMISKSLAYGGPSLLVSAVRLPASPTLSQLPWPCRSRPRPSHQPLCQELEVVPSPPSGEGPDDYIRLGPSATPSTRKRPVQISTVSSPIISSLHGKYAPEDNGCSHRTPTCGPAQPIHTDDTYTQHSQAACSNPPNRQITHVSSVNCQ